MTIFLRNEQEVKILSYKRKQTKKMFKQTYSKRVTKGSYFMIKEEIWEDQKRRKYIKSKNMAKYNK